MVQDRDPGHLMPNPIRIILHYKLKLILIFNISTLYLIILMQVIIQQYLFTIAIIFK